MPAVSKAQLRLVAAKAAGGEPWAKRWMSEMHGNDYGNLPERKGDVPGAHMYNALQRRRRKRGKRS